jgi:CheY-like chemotaxis protein
MEIKPNVLVIDDNAVLRNSLKQLLEKLGCAVATADTAETGIEQLQRSRYDAIFSALCLKQFGGTGMARWVKDNAAEGTKFFLTTSWKGELEPELLRSIGIQDVIRDPYDYNKLRDTMREHFAG